MNTPHGTLYLVPNTLDFGVPGPTADLQDLLPLGVIRVASQLGHWIAENAKTTRVFLKRVDAVVPLALPLQSISIVELPRPQKGASNPARAHKGDAVKAPVFDAAALLEPALRGLPMGLISEAGLPAVADPGAAVVAAAHALELHVVALPGASSLLLALAASGLNGQSFAIVGYVPTEPGPRAARIRELEALSQRLAQTQLMIEAPYRNPVLLSALLEHLQPATRLSVSCGLTLANGFTRTDSVEAWRARPTVLPADVPAVFALLLRN